MHMCRYRMSTRTEKVLSLLSSMVSESRRVKIASVVESRTRNICVLLEDVHDRGNTNAVLRSMEAFGFLDVHQVASANVTLPLERKRQTQMRTDAGARQWINVIRWTSSEECVRYLKEKQGFKIACASPDAPITLSQVDFRQRVALAFGNEAHGISKYLLDESDVTFSIPMVGFVQSFNVSVSIAISLYAAYSQRVLERVSCEIKLVYKMVW